MRIFQRISSHRLTAQAPASRQRREASLQNGFFHACRRRNSAIKACEQAFYEPKYLRGGEHHSKYRPLQRLSFLFLRFCRYIALLLRRSRDQSGKAGEVDFTVNIIIKAALAPSKAHTTHLISYGFYVVSQSHSNKVTRVSTPWALLVALTCSSLQSRSVGRQ